MKYLHFLRDHGYPDTPLKEALVSLRKAIRPSTPFWHPSNGTFVASETSTDPLAEQVPGSTQDAYSKKRINLSLQLMKASNSFTVLQVDCSKEMATSLGKSRRYHRR